MKAALLRDVRGDVLVAVLAQFGLLGFFEIGMTSLATRFEICVTGR